MTAGPDLFDLFLSHATPDKVWVRTLNEALVAAGLKPYFDVNELQPADNFVSALGDGLQRSRFLVVVLTKESVDRLWVVKEWTTFMSLHGPHGRVIPVLLDTVDLPPMLRTCQGIWANDCDAGRVAKILAARIGKRSDVPEGDTRGLYIGQDLAFHLDPTADDQLRVIRPDGKDRTLPIPTADPTFGQSLLAFRRLARQAATTDSDRASLTHAAIEIGKRLFATLFDDAGRDILARATLPGAPRALLTVRSKQDALLALPWELLHDGTRFLVRDGVLDLARSTPDETYPGPVEYSGPFGLVVNVSAPTGQGHAQLNYEEESYRITRAVGEACRMTPTELGTLDDLIDTCVKMKPRGVHFSGHGGPGLLLFEDEIGGPDRISIHKLVTTMRKKLPDGKLPPFFYLANCHGNDPAGDEAESSAARLHREGVDQVVGYHGPIVDELSTRAEESLYAAIAAGHPTRYAVRLARNALETPFGDSNARLREPGAGASTTGLFPMAWAQLVYYHRGADAPLGKPEKPGSGTATTAPPEREYAGGDKRMLTTGFIGRRREMHAIRKRIRAGGPESRVFVFQGFGGLGKTTLQFQMPTLLKIDRADMCVLWCADAEKQPKLVEALTKQLSDYAEKRFGAQNWIGVIQAVDQKAGADPVARFAMFLSVLLQNVEKLLLVVDNLESLLTGPGGPRKRRANPKAFAKWKNEDAARWWSFVREQASHPGKLVLVASTRYQHPDYAKVQLRVSDLPPDAVFRLTAWFPSLCKLTPTTRAILVGKLAGHPRAVEYTDDLVRDQFEKLDARGVLPPAGDATREWAEVVAPVLPEVDKKLEANLLLKEIWEKVLDEKMRRMLYRMTLLRRPWEFDLHAVLGEPDETAEAANQTAEELSRTSLLMREDYPNALPDFSLHPALAAFVRRRFADDEAIRQTTHLRVGTHLEAATKTTKYIEIDLEAGYHLFQAREYARACKLLDAASDWLQQRGRAVEGLTIMEPFLHKSIRTQLSANAVCQLLNIVGINLSRLSRIAEAIDLHKQQLAIASQIGNRLWEGCGLHELGNAYTHLGRMEDAIEHYLKALVINREIGYRQAEGTTLGGLGIAYAFLSRIEEAIECHHQQLVIAREIGHRQGEGDALGNLGNAYSDLNRMEEAIECYHQVLVIAREIGDRQGEGRALGNLGSAYSDLNRTEETIECYHQALVIAREIGDRRCAVSALGNLGRALRRLGRVEEAIGCHEQSLIISREIGDRQGEANTLGNLGLTYADLGRLEEAIPLLEQALRIGQEIQDPRIVNTASRALAKVRGEAPDSPPRGERGCQSDHRAT